MENTCLQYENSLTRQAEESMDIWTKELADMSEELMNDPMAVVRSLNDARNLCTAGFLMRRQIQASFSELLRDASEETGESYEDLTVNNNVPWPECFYKSLCKIQIVFADYNFAVFFNRIILSPRFKWIS